MDNNRRTHAAKVLAKSSRKHQSTEEDVEVDQAEKSKTSAQKSLNRDALSDQYAIIRADILKLREDLADGYDLLKDFIETKISRRTLVKSK